MKQMKTLTLAFCLIFFMSGCSMIQRSSVNQMPANSVQHQPQQKSQSSMRYQTPATKQKPAITRQGSQRAPTTAQINLHPARNRMIQIATSTIGTPYKWGGDNPQKGFDCSGLMSFVHKNALGMKIPRTAAKQRDASRTISYNQLLPGDMLFFRTGRNSNHVGVYVGNRRFVHAASGSKHVKIASMDNAYWHKRFVKFGSFM